MFLHAHIVNAQELIDSGHHVDDVVLAHGVLRVLTWGTLYVFTGFCVNFNRLAVAVIASMLLAPFGMAVKEHIDTTTPTGKFMLAVFGAVAELERGYILQRQDEGIEVAKRAGGIRGIPTRLCQTTLESW